MTVFMKLLDNDFLHDNMFHYYKLIIAPYPYVATPLPTEVISSKGFPTDRQTCALQSYRYCILIEFTCLYPEVL